MRPSPLHLLHRAEQVANRLFEDGALGFTTPRQLAVLIAVSENEGLNQTDVVKRTGIDRGTMAEIIPRMLRKGLLQRRRSRTDTRAKLLRLTDEGRLLLAAAEPVARNLDAALLQALPQAQREPFIRALEAVVRALEGEIRLSGYENSPDYGGPEPWWREAGAILAVIGTVAGAICELRRLLLYWGLIGGGWAPAPSLARVACTAWAGRPAQPAVRSGA